MNALKSAYRAMNATMPSECFLDDNLPVPAPADNLKKHLSGLSDDALGNILEATAYAANGVAIGFEAGRDADIHYAAQNEIDSRLA